jgi:hypothetical protein
MNKTLVPLIVLIIFLAGCSKSNGPGPKPTVKKKVSKIVGLYTSSQVGKPSSEKIPWSTQEFDSNHQLTLSSNRAGHDDLDIHDSQLDTITFKYTSGKLMEKKDKSFWYKYAYNGADTVEVQQYGSLNSVVTETREYGSNQKLAKSFSVDAPGNPLEMRIYGYDAKKNNTTIDITYYNFNKPPFEYQLIFTYDDRQNVLTQFFTSPKTGTKGLQWRYGYKYDSDNRLVEYVRNTLYPVEYRKWKNTYNAEGELIKQDILQSDNFDGPFEQVGTVDYFYTY